MSTPNRIGTDRILMESTCTNVRNYAKEVNILIEELQSLTNSLPQYWEGDNLEIFTAQFLQFKAKLQQLPEVLEALINVADNTSQEYQNIVEKSKQDFNMLFGGIQ